MQGDDELITAQLQLLLQRVYHILLGDNPVIAYLIKAIMLFYTTNQQPTSAQKTRLLLFLLAAIAASSIINPLIPWGSQELKRLLTNCWLDLEQEDWVLCRVFFKNREVASKPSCFGLDRGISSLPPLMDSYITFDPTQQPGNSMNSDFGDVQVPCFSNIFSQQPQPSTIFPHLGFLNTVPAKNNDMDVSASVAAAATASYGSASSAVMAGLGSCFGTINYNPSDKKMLKALRNQLNKVEPNNNIDSNVKESSLSLGEGSSDSFLSEVGMPAGVSGWGHYWLIIFLILRGLIYKF